MDVSSLSDISRRALEIFFIIAVPFLGVTLAVGLIISFLQTLTNIQEATLTFVPKIIVVFILLFILGSFIVNQINDFMKELFSAIPEIIK